MSKKRKRSLKTSFDDVARPEVPTESRRFTVNDKTCEHPSSIVWWIECPFCKNEVKAYLWSLAGGGKRCECGAILGHYGDAHRRVGPLVKREGGPETGFAPDRCGDADPTR